MIVKYFINFEYSLANGFLLVLPLISEYSVIYLIPVVFEHTILPRALGIGFLLIVCSYIMLGIMCFLDEKVDHHDNELLIRYKKRNQFDLEEDYGRRNAYFFEFGYIKLINRKFWLLAVSYML